jgi:hypothetical protein
MPALIWFPVNVYIHSPTLLPCAVYPRPLDRVIVSSPSRTPEKCMSVDPLPLPPRRSFIASGPTTPGQMAFPVPKVVSSWSQVNLNHEVCQFMCRPVPLLSSKPFSLPSLLSSVRPPVKYPTDALVSMAPLNTPPTAMPVAVAPLPLAGARSARWRWPTTPGQPLSSPLINRNKPRDAFDQCTRGNGCPQTLSAGIGSRSVSSLLASLLGHTVWC